MDSAAQRIEFMDHDLTPDATRVGEWLVAKGLVTEQQVHQAVEAQTRFNTFLGQILVDLGHVSANQVGATLSEFFDVPYVDLLNLEPHPDAVSLVPEDIVRSNFALPIRLGRHTIDVAMVDPFDVSAIDQIHAITGRRVVPHLTMMGELQKTINDLYDASSRTNAALKDLLTEKEAAGAQRLSRAEVASASEEPIVRLVDSILESAVAKRASDIHFEPQERVLRVRLRVDGILLDHAEVPRAQMASVVARVKVLCTMDVTESRRPQDGRLSHNYHGRVFDVRVSSVPTVHGEKLVLRVLDKAAVLMPLSKLGFLPEQQRQFEELIRQPHGMVVVVGPTGSGKSTTLYSSLNLLNDMTRNIMTLEDPVEYYVPGLNQVQINSRLGLTFASGLRTFVRQDPDVILVGEIRDSETAEMAVQAALTGHLLLSTLHTNSAVGAIPRLVNLGLDPFLIGQSLTGVVSQRLVARVCAHCAVPSRPDPDVLKAVHIDPIEAAGWPFKRGRGCRQCNGRGYRGRMSVYEILTIDEEIRSLIMRGARDTEIQEAAEHAGMMSLWESAKIAVCSGIITPEEMGRVVLTRED